MSATVPSHHTDRSLILAMSSLLGLSPKCVQLVIYTIIILNYVCLSQLANCRLQFLLDRLGRCLKLFVSTESKSCHEFASQFGLAIFYTRKTPKNYREIRVSRKFLLSEQGCNASHGRSITSDQPNRQEHE